MLFNVSLFIVSFLVVIYSANYATQYAIHIAKSFRLSKYIVGFVVVAIISVLPEAFISISAALQGVPAFGLGTLFGSNVADLTFVFAVIILWSGRELAIKSEMLKYNIVYPLFLLLPVLFGLNGHYSRIEGAALLVVGILFYLFTFGRNHAEARPILKDPHRYRNMFLLFLSMGGLLVGSHMTVFSATAIAQNLHVSPVLIGMLVVGLGTTIPELMFSLRSLKKHDDELAAGDLLGTVLTDALIIVGILALIRPFSFPPTIVYSMGVFMVAAACLLLYCMKTGRTITKKESVLLFFFYVLFVCTEFFISR